jgi:hypothetical protein
MSKTWEHYQVAAYHHERAAVQFKQAAKYHQSEEHEKAAHHAYLAHGHAEHAVVHERAAAKLHVERCGSDDNPVFAQHIEKTAA